MRWLAIQKVWSLCKAAFPKKALWPDVPYRFGKQGGIKVFDMESGKQVTEVKYETHPNKIVFKAKDLFEEIPLEKKDGLAFSVNRVKTSDFIRTQKLGSLLAKNYSGEDLLYQASLLYEQEPQSLQFDQWLASNEFPDEIVKIAEKKKYKKYQRVRINNPLSMEHNEMGVILDIVGDRKKGLRYLIMVDGSSQPMWFDQNSLHMNLSGVIVNE
jgi:hypothetical protein